jgi:hypothetical protein
VCNVFWSDQDLQSLFIPQHQCWFESLVMYKQQIWTWDHWKLSFNTQLHDWGLSSWSCTIKQCKTFWPCNLYLNFPHNHHWFREELVEVAIQHNFSPVLEMFLTQDPHTCLLQPCVRNVSFNALVVKDL